MADKKREGFSENSLASVSIFYEFRNHKYFLAAFFLVFQHFQFQFDDNRKKFYVQRR